MKRALVLKHSQKCGEPLRSSLWFVGCLQPEYERVPILAAQASGLAEVERAKAAYVRFR